MRYEVRQQDGKWIVWDTVNCESMKALPREFLVSHGGIAQLLIDWSLAERLRPTVGDRSPRAIIEAARPYMFWTQAEAQQLADTLNAMRSQGGQA